LEDGRAFEVDPQGEEAAVGIFWGVVLVVLSLVCWGGQTLSWLAPEMAARWGLTEAEAEVEPVYWVDIRGEAPWDAFTLWTMLVAGVLLVFDNAAWAYFGLVGGGMYLYFAGRGIVTRILMQRRGFRIGTPTNVVAAHAMLVVWGAMALITIVAAVVALPTG
jgi:hypothetical protein